MVELLKLKDVTRITGLSRSVIYRGINAGTFPRPVNLSKRCVRWPSDVIETWVSEVIAESEKEKAQP